VTEAPATAVHDRLRTWHPGWTGVALGTGGTALASLLDPLPGTRVDDVVGAVLAAAAVVLLGLVVPLVLRARRHRDAALADLAQPGLGALYGTAPAALLVAAVALGQLGVLGMLPAGIAWVALAALAIGLVATLVVGMAFFLRIVDHEALPVPPISGAWFVPIVALVLVPSVVARLVVLQPAWASSAAVALAVAAWGAGLLLFLLLAPVVAWRLITAPAPPPHMAASWWIWLAPAGAGGLGLLASTRLAAALLEQPALASAGLLGASALWGFAVWWALFAGAHLRTVARRHGGLPFHVGSWGFAFPTAAVAALTLELGRSWDSPLLSAVGSVGWAAALAVWGVLAWQTLRGARDGSIFAR